MPVAPFLVDVDVLQFRRRHRRCHRRRRQNMSKIDTVLSI